MFIGISIYVYQLLCMYCRKNQTLEEVIKDVRTHHSIVIPANIDDWFELHRTIVDIRRNHIFEDGIKAAKREEFDPTQLLQVQLIFT